MKTIMSLLAVLGVVAYWACTCEPPRNNAAAYHAVHSAADLGRRVTPAWEHRDWTAVKPAPRTETLHPGAFTALMLAVVLGLAAVESADD